jgi:hypothetical protein
VQKEIPFYKEISPSFASMGLHSNVTLTTLTTKNQTRLEVEDHAKICSLLRYRIDCGRKKFKVQAMGLDHVSLYLYLFDTTLSLWLVPRKDELPLFRFFQRNDLHFFKVGSAQENSLFKLTR